MSTLPSICESTFANARFSHPVEHTQLIETHISWVVLTGTFAYKIKKPVDLGFVDYSTLDKRKHYCDLELQLNRRFAPDIYLDVVPVFRTKQGIRIGEQRIPAGDQQIIDYAVKMKEFSQDAIVATRMSHPELTVESVEAFGCYLAEFHSQIETVDPDVQSANPQSILEDAGENFDELLAQLTGDKRFQRLLKLEKWTNLQGKNLANSFASRLERGKVKRCHGDLHLKNVIQLDGQLLAFDGIEFNERFQCIDILSEIAFPVMDFFARGRSDLGWRLLNSYLEATADYTDLDVLRFYLVYRAMVRAKVSWLNPRNHFEARKAEYADDSRPDDLHPGPWDKYLKVAEEFAFGMGPKLSITHGFSGSGKSTVAMQLIEKHGGIRIRSDVLRHQLADSLGATNKYSSEMSDRVYDRLMELSRNGLVAGFPIVADATFLKSNQRMPFLDLARKMCVAFEIIDCDATFEELCRRLEERVNDPSEADVSVLKMQRANHDPLSAEELQLVQRG